MLPTARSYGGVGKLSIRQPALPARGPRRPAQPRTVVHAGLIGLSAVCAPLYVVDIGGPVRLVLALAAMALLPGAAVLTRLPTADPAVWLGLAVAISLAVETVASLVMAWTGWWHPGPVAGALAAVCVLVLLVDVRRTRSWAHRTAP